MRPRIGITCSSKIRDGRDLAALEKAYVSGVSRAGGLPFVLPILTPADALDVVDSLDGLLIAGGGDIDPVLYGAATAPETHGVDRHRDLYELALLHAANDRSLPVLGVCRGLQVINVALGGTLVQHIPNLTGVNHRDDARARKAVHPITVEPGTFLASVLGTTSVKVNSLHHQAVDDLGRGLAVAARAKEGTVEAVVSTDHDRLVGVQWHPELLGDTRASKALFRWLVESAARLTSAVA
jgi:putative glutamine amidotransferase